MRQLRAGIRKLSGHGGQLRPQAPIRICLLVIAFAVALVGAAETVSEEDVNAASIGLCIPRQVKLRERICLEPPYETTDADRLLADPVRVSVATNVPHWGLAVKISASDGRPLGAVETGTVLCRLRDEDGAVIVETALDNGVALLHGNGRCGSHEVFLEILDVSTAATAARPRGFSIDIRGSEGHAP
jgi:hypothetical protein